MLSRVLGPACLVACALLAACGNSSPAGGAPSATTAAPLPPPHPPEPPSASPTATATASTLAPPTPSVSASAQASDSAAAPALADAGAPRSHGGTAHEAHDAGAADAGPSMDAGTVASVSPAQQIAQQIDAVFAGKKTFFAHFKQHYDNHVTGATTDSTGVVHVERPGKLAFIYDPPSQNRIVSDGATLKTYMASDAQMIVTPVRKAAYPAAFGFIMGGGIANAFDFTLGSQPGYTGAVLDGKPLAADPSCEMVRFLVDRGLLAAGDPSAVQRVLIVDVQHNKNRFDLTGVTQPPTIAPAVFTFTPPPGTNIITQP